MRTDLQDASNNEIIVFLAIRSWNLTRKKDDYDEIIGLINQAQVPWKKEQKFSQNCQVAAQAVFQDSVTIYLLYVAISELPKTINYTI